MIRPNLSLGFPLINTATGFHQPTLQAKTLQLLAHALSRKEVKPQMPTKRPKIGKENQQNFKQVEEGLKKYNQKQQHSGSLALHLPSRISTPEILETQKISRSRSAYSTTYETYNRHLQLCRNHSQGPKQEEKTNCKKSTTIQRIMAPTNPMRPKQGLKLIICRE